MTLTTLYCYASFGYKSFKRGTIIILIMIFIWNVTCVSWGEHHRKCIGRGASVRSHPRGNSGRKDLLIEKIGRIYISTWLRWSWAEMMLSDMDMDMITSIVLIASNIDMTIVLDAGDGFYLRLGNEWAADLPRQWTAARRRGTSPKGGAERQQCSSQSKML